MLLNDILQHDLKNSAYLDLKDDKGNIYEGQVCETEANYCIGRIYLENGEFYEGTFYIRPKK